MAAFKPPSRVGSKRFKPAMSPQTKPSFYTDRRYTNNARAEHLMNRKQTSVKFESPTSKASKIDLATVPTQVPRPTARPSTKKNGTKDPRIKIGFDLYQKLGDFIFEGDMSTSITELKTDSSPPPPIEVSYRISQTGSSTRLKEWKKQYPSTSYELPKLTSYIQPTSTQPGEDREVNETTAASFGRSNVHWPFAWADNYNYYNHYTATSLELLTSQQSCFNRSQIERCLHTMYQNAFGGTSTGFDDFLANLENLRGGDQSYAFPMDAMESQFRYENRNVMTPCNISLYICTPKSDLVGQHSPQRDWFNPFSADTTNLLTTDGLLMDPDYRYDPVVTAQENVIKTGNGSADTVTMGVNNKNILTLSTEVVPEASPSGFSKLFNENWEILTVKQIRLQAGQVLILNLGVELSKLLDLDRFLGYDPGTDRSGNEYFKRQSFEGLTLFPMIKFYGDPISGASQGLSKGVATGTDRPEMTNRVFQSSKPLSGPCMITASQTNKCRISVPAAPLRGTDVFLTTDISAILVNLTTKARNLFKYNSPERGQQTEYFKVNDFAKYFAGETLLSDGTKYTQVATIRTHVTTVGPSSDPTSANVELLNPKKDLNFVEITTASTRSQKSLKADVGEKA